MRINVLAAVLMSFVVGWVAGCQLSSDQPVDRSSSSAQGTVGPVFKVSDLLPAQVIRGQNYQIEPRVPVVDYNYMFRIRTKYGVVPAHGTDMLELRLREMHSIRLADNLRRAAHIEAGIMDNLEKTGQGLEELLTDPGGALLRAPQGLGLMVKQELDAADRRAGSPARRQLAAHVQCDPETSNPVLKKMLDEMALKQGIGGFMTGTAMGMVIPGMGLLSTTTDIKDMVATTPPHQINAQIESQLERMRVDRRLREKFCRDMNYTTTERLIFMSYFRSLSQIEGAYLLVRAATEARTEADGLGVIHEAKLWTELHRRRPAKRFFSAGVPVAELQEGTMVVLAVADYVNDTKEVSDAVAQYRKNHPAAPSLVCLSGRFSPGARQTLQAADIRIAEGGQWPWP